MKADWSTSEVLATCEYAACQLCCVTAVNRAWVAPSGVLLELPTPASALPAIAVGARNLLPGKRKPRAISTAVPPTIRTIKVRFITWPPADKPARRQEPGTQPVREPQLRPGSATESRAGLRECCCRWEGCPTTRLPRARALHPKESAARAEHLLSTTR